MPAGRTLAFRSFFEFSETRGLPNISHWPCKNDGNPSSSMFELFGTNLTVVLLVVIFTQGLKSLNVTVSDSNFQEILYMNVASTKIAIKYRKMHSKKVHFLYF